MEIWPSFCLKGFALAGTRLQYFICSQKGATLGVCDRETRIASIYFIGKTFPFSTLKFLALHSARNAPIYLATKQFTCIVVSIYHVAPKQVDFSDEILKEA